MIFVLDMPKLQKADKKWPEGVLYSMKDTKWFRLLDLVFGIRSYVGTRKEECISWTVRRFGSWSLRFMWLGLFMFKYEYGSLSKEFAYFEFCVNSHLWVLDLHCTLDINWFLLSVGEAAYTRNAWDGNDGITWFNFTNAPRRDFSSATETCLLCNQTSDEHR